MKKEDIEFIKHLVLKELNLKKEEFKETKNIDLIKEIDYLKDLLERL